MGTSYAPNIVKDGLIFSVDAANPRSYPGSGTTVTDLINNISGDLENDVSITSTPSNFVFGTSGIDDYIDLGNESILNPTETTIIAWANPTTVAHVSSYFPRVMTKSDLSDRSYEFGVFQNDNSILFQGRQANNTWNYAHGPANSVPNNQWTCIAFSFKIGETCKAYTNGTEVSSYQDQTTPTQGLISTSGNAMIARASQHSDGYWNGQIGPIQMYNRALSAQEIKQNYNALKGRFQ
jgi:hypothetical protein